VSDDAEREALELILSGTGLAAGWEQLVDRYGFDDAAAGWEAACNRIDTAGPMSSTVGTLVLNVEPDTNRGIR